MIPHHPFVLLDGDQSTKKVDVGGYTSMHMLCKMRRWTIIQGNAFQHIWSCFGQYHIRISFIYDWGRLSSYCNTGCTCRCRSSTYSGHSRKAATVVSTHDCSIFIIYMFSTLLIMLFVSW